MRGRIKKAIALFSGVALSVAICVTTIPGLSATVYAAGTGKNIQLGASALEDNANTSSAATVYYDSSSDTWRVIGYNGTGVASSSGTLTLIASGNMAHGSFNSSYADYSRSNLVSMIGNLAGRLSTEESSAVATRTLEGGSAWRGEDGYDENKIRGRAVSDAVMWPLSVAEAKAMNSDLRKADSEHTDWNSSYWWLRSPGEYDENAHTAAFVHGEGYVIEDGRDVSIADFGARPAFNLNLSSIIFTSDSTGIKSSGAAGTLSAPGTHSSENWKLTLKSDSLAVSSGTVTRSGSTITVPYNALGNYERISVFISNGEWNSSGAELKYYGVLDTSDSSGTFTLPDEYADKTCGSDYHAYILAEDINEGNATDYASEPVEIVVPGSSATPTDTATALSGKRVAFVIGLTALAALVIVVFGVLVYKKRKKGE